jgi:hypothetical protein
MFNQNFYQRFQQQFPDFQSRMPNWQGQIEQIKAQYPEYQQHMHDAQARLGDVRANVDQRMGDVRAKLDTQMQNMKARQSENMQNLQNTLRQYQPNPSTGAAGSAGGTGGSTGMANQFQFNGQDALQFAQDALSKWQAASQDGGPHSAFIQSALKEGFDPDTVMGFIRSKINLG